MADHDNVFDVIVVGAGASRPDRRHVQAVVKEG